MKVRYAVLKYGNIYNEKLDMLSKIPAIYVMKVRYADLRSSNICNES